MPFAYDFHSGTDTIVIQDENWVLNRAKTTVAYLENELVTKLKWPVQSMDLNPVENRLGFTKSTCLREVVSKEPFACV